MKKYKPNLCIMAELKLCKNKIAEYDAHTGIKSGQEICSKCRDKYDITKKLNAWLTKEKRRKLRLKNET